MQANFDVFDFAAFLGRHWRTGAASCLAAALVTLGVSLALPKRYTASASIVIEPPGGLDSRTATAVSPVYLESLRTYERFAGSDSMFREAEERFHFGGSQVIETLKQRVLKVTKLRDTKILVIEVTLGDPGLAHSVAAYLAAKTVEMSRAESRAADAEMIAEWEGQEASARQALERAQRAWADDARTEPVDSLEADLEGLRELQFDIRRQIVDARAQDAADGRASAHTAALESQAAEIERTIGPKGTALATRKTRRDRLRGELDGAQKAWESAVNRLRDLRAANSTRGERLSVIDPGIVPQRPTAPNVTLNVLAALFLSAAMWAGYSSLLFAGRRRTPLEAAPSRSLRAG